MLGLIAAPFVYLLRTDHPIMAVALLISIIGGYAKGRESFWTRTIYNCIAAFIVVFLLHAGHPYYAGTVVGIYALWGLL